MGEAMVKLNHSEYFFLDWLARNEGATAMENQGRVFDRLLLLQCIEVRDGRIYLTAYGKQLQRAG